VNKEDMMIEDNEHLQEIREKMADGEVVHEHEVKKLIHSGEIIPLESFRTLNVEATPSEYRNPVSWVRDKAREGKEKRVEAKKAKMEALTMNNGLPASNAELVDSQNTEEFMVLYDKNSLDVLNEVKKRSISIRPEAFISGLMWISPVTIATDIPAAAVLLGVVPYAFGLTAFAHFLVRKMNPQKLSIYQRVKEESQRVFTNWLKDEHNILISTKTADKLSPVYLANGHPGAVLTFQDAVTGKTHYIKIGETGTKATLLTNYDGTSKAHNAAEAASKALTHEDVTLVLPELPEGLQKLYDDVISIAERLKKQSLSPEGEHTVGRVQQDAYQAVLAYRQTILLDPTEKDSIFTQQVFEWLAAELADVTKTEVDLIRGQIEVQNQYVRQRQAKSGLNFTKPKP
jgi:hypothetical protein